MAWWWSYGGGRFLMSKVPLYAEKHFDTLNTSIRPTRMRQRYRGTSLIRNRTHLGTYSRTMPMALQWS